MKIKGMPLLVAVLTGAVIVLVWLFWNEREENALLVTKLASAKAPATAGRAANAAPATVRQSPPLRVGPPDQTVMPAEVVEREEQRLKDARFILVDRKIRERLVQNRYAYLLQTLGPLDATVTSKLKALLVEREGARLDADRGAIKQGIAPNSVTYKQATDQASAEVNRAISELLGDRAAEFTRLDRLSGIVENIGQTWGGDLTFASVPLSHEQTLRLAEIMFEIHYNRRDPEFRALHLAEVDPETGLKPLFREFLPRAAAILSPEQLKVVRAYHDELVAGQGYLTAGSGPR
jgi:hypothetical protein